MDLPAPAVATARTCGACPVGYFGDGERCGSCAIAATVGREVEALRATRGDAVVVRGWAGVTNPNGTAAGVCNTVGGLAFWWTVRKAGEAAMVRLDSAGSDTGSGRGRGVGGGVTGLGGPVLTLPPLTLAANTSYDFTLAVCYSGSSTAACAHDVVRVNVGTSALRPALRGGGVTVRSTQQVVLDASGSSDPDDPAAALEYQWECVRVRADTNAHTGTGMGISDGACVAIVEASSTASNASGTTPQGATMTTVFPVGSAFRAGAATATLPPGLVGGTGAEGGITYRVTLTVRRAGSAMGAARTSAAVTTTVRILAAAAGARAGDASLPPPPLVVLDAVAASVSSVGFPHVYPPHPLSWTPHTE